jgi:hypothetical protein
MAKKKKESTTETTPEIVTMTTPEAREANAEQVKNVRPFPAEDELVKLMLTHWD